MSSFQPLSTPSSTFAFPVPAMTEPTTCQRHTLDDLCSEPLTPERLNQLQDALYCLPVAQYCDDRPQWLTIIAALSTEANRSPDHADRLLALADEWSQQSASYEPGCVATLWDSFGDQYAGQPATLGTIFHLAKQHGFSFRNTAPEPVTTDADGMPFGIISHSDLRARDFVINYLVDELLAERQDIVIGGWAKSLKTSLVVDLIVSLATGEPFLGQFDIPNRRKSLVLSAESGLEVLREIAARVCAARGVSLDALDNMVSWGDRLPYIDNPQHLTALRTILKTLRPDVLVVDPLYKCLQVGSDASNVMAVGDKLNRISMLCREHGVTLICCHHIKKSSAGKKELDLSDLSQAGFAEHFRQFVLLNRETPYQFDGNHDLKMSVSASCGISAQYSLRIREGLLNTDGERKWDVDVRTAGEHAEAPSQQQLTAESHVVMDIMLAQGTVTSKKSLHAPAKQEGLSQRRCDAAFGSLLANGQIERVPVGRGKWTYQIREATP